MILLKEAVSAQKAYDLLNTTIMKLLIQFRSAAKADTKARAELKTSKEVQHYKPKFDQHDWVSTRVAILNCIKTLINDGSLKKTFWNKYVVAADKGTLSSGGLFSSDEEIIENYVKLIDLVNQMVVLS